MLTDHRILVTGVVNEGSIAHAVARRAAELGAEVVLTALARDRHLTEAAAASLDPVPPIHDLDLTDEAAAGALAARLWARYGRFDGAVHAVAFAPRRVLAGDFVSAAGDDVDRAFRASTHSYAVLARMLRHLHSGRGGSLVGLDFDAARAWPVYDWMGVCKAALESTNRYVARDLGPDGIRSNLVAAGPLHTRAAGGIPGFEVLTDAWERGAAIKWDPTDAEPVADAVCFLLSPLARAITGTVVHVDGGYHAMAAALR